MKWIIFSIFYTYSLVSFSQIDWEQLDGIISNDEKIAFQKLGENGSSEISIAKTVDYLKVNVSSDTMYVASLCLCTNTNKTMVLHASAALGNVNYDMDSNGSWNTTDSFDWQMRESDMSEKTKQMRAEHLKKYGWVANTLGMGSRKQVEFIISKAFVNSSSISLAAGLMPKADPENIIGLPANSAGDCADFKLVAGPPNPTYQFKPKGWYKIGL